MLDGVGQTDLQRGGGLLAAPHAAVKAELTLEQVELAQFQAIASRHNVALRRRVLSATGTMEYAPIVKLVHLRQATIERLQVDYIHTAQTAESRETAGPAGKQMAQEVSNAPGILLRADQLRLVGATLGFVNRAARPEYRLFLDHAEVHLQNVSNQLTEGTAVAKVTGRFMGSGRTVVGANFRPRRTGRTLRWRRASKTPTCGLSILSYAPTASSTWPKGSSRCTPKCGCGTVPCKAMSNPSFARWMFTTPDRIKTNIYSSSFMRGLWAALARCWKTSPVGKWRPRRISPAHLRTRKPAPGRR